MRFKTLDEWLAWQEGLHPSAIDMDLERITKVMEIMGLGQPDYIVVTVAGTNGKGSSVAMLEAILTAAGYRVGAYTSPHLLRYNERIRITGREAEDDALCQAFEHIDQARGPISLTYFEFATLAAFELFAHAAIDIAILEVGMGGRLDAVNAVDSDVALVTSIGVDHVKWLGDDRNAIAAEKAGIFRAGRPAVCGDPDPPASLINHAAHIGTRLYCNGSDFSYQLHDDGWSWRYGQIQYHGLPLPLLSGEFQLQNAAAVLMVLVMLDKNFRVERSAIEQGLQRAMLPGRFQVLAGPVQTILDVAHNPHGAQALAGCLRATDRQGKCYAVVAMLEDKDIAGVFKAMQGSVDRYYVAALDVPQGATTSQMIAGLEASGEQVPVIACDKVLQAYHQALIDIKADARAETGPGDRIIVFGSFYTVATILKYYQAGSSGLN